MSLTTVAVNMGGTGAQTPNNAQTNLQTLGFKNRIINGAIGISQRGASVAVGTSPTYFADRFAGMYSTSVTGTLSQQSSGRTDFPNCARAQRTSGQTATGNMSVLQVLESANCIGMAGQSVTFSFWARAGSNYSASAGNLAALAYTGTGTDQSSSSFMAGSWSGLTAIINSTVALTTSWQKFTLTGAAGSTANQFAILFQGALTGTAGANDFYEITGVQLEVGSSGTTFDYRPYTTELQLCQRYFQATTILVYSSSFARNFVMYPVQMRTAPTVAGGGSGFTLSISSNAGTAMEQTSAAGQNLTFSSEL
jgi:hypothetical protein